LSKGHVVRTLCGRTFCRWTFRGRTFCTSTLFLFHERNGSGSTNSIQIATCRWGVLVPVALTHGLSSRTSLKTGDNTNAKFVVRYSTLMKGCQDSVYGMNLKCRN
jgi:hypothetical protein